MPKTVRTVYVHVSTHSIVAVLLKYKTVRLIRARRWHSHLYVVATSAVRNRSVDLCAAVSRYVWTVVADGARTVSTHGCAGSRQLR